MEEQLAGRAAFVTGASNGLGRAIAEHLGALGMDVWLIGREPQALEEVAAKIRAGGAKAWPTPLDVRRPGAVAAAIAAVDHPHLYAVVNSAGVMHPEPILRADPERWRALVETNLLATLESCQAAVRKMRAEGKSGRLINFSSLMAHWQAGGVYGATKAAVEMIGRTLHRELEGDDIRVTTVIPGGFATQLRRGLEPAEVEKIVTNIKQSEYPVERLRGDPMDVARLVAFLLRQPIDLSISEIVVRPPADLTI